MVPPEGPEASPPPQAATRRISAAAGVVWMVAGALIGYVGLVQLGLTGVYPRPNVANAAVDACGTIIAFAIGVSLIRRPSSRALTISLVVAGIVVIAGVYQLTQGIGRAILPLCVAAAGIAGVLSALALWRRGRATADVDPLTEPRPAGSRTDRIRFPNSIRGRSVSPLMVVSVVAAVVGTVAVVDRALRSALTLDIRWDAFYYHIPGAAIWGGLSVPYDMNDVTRPLFDGYPPLPEMVQGLLWRVTGSVNATGVANFLASACSSSTATRSCARRSGSWH